jgi:hypothetical protein
VYIDTPWAVLILQGLARFGTAGWFEWSNGGPDRVKIRPHGTSIEPVATRIVRRFEVHSWPIGSVGCCG